MVRILYLIFIFLSIGESRECKVFIDIGHTPVKYGALSARGVPEYNFNKVIALKLKEKINQKNGISSYIINIDGKNIPLKKRIPAENTGGRCLFISIHHDSVKPRFLKKWNFLGKELLYSDKFKGYSLIVSKKNKYFKESLRIAKSIGKSILKMKYLPSKYHKMNIKGENREYFSETYGVMRIDDLIVLKYNKIPAVLIETGVIVNRDEELNLTDPEFIEKFTSSVSSGIFDWCKK